MDNVEGVARVLCVRSGDDPDRLEPGNVCAQTWMDEEKLAAADYDHLFDEGKIPSDGINSNGDKCNFAWREHIFDAKAALQYRLTVTDEMVQRACICLLKHDEAVPSKVIRDALEAALNDAEV